uniref:Uncharacterized protein n=1 Tax=Lepeophtheirus salmonis TaxID=72036 RepID=A0A0K2TZJ4_LEPSM
MDFLLVLFKPKKYLRDLFKVYFKYDLKDLKDIIRIKHFCFILD